MVTLDQCRKGRCFHCGWECSKKTRQHEWGKRAVFWRCLIVVSFVYRLIWPTLNEHIGACTTLNFRPTWRATLVAIIESCSWISSKVSEDAESSVAATLQDTNFSMRSIDKSGLLASTQILRHTLGSEGVFPGVGHQQIFPKYFKGGKSSEICFFPLETEKTTVFFPELFKIQGRQGHPAHPLPMSMLATCVNTSSFFTFQPQGTLSSHTDVQRAFAVFNRFV